MKHTRYDAARVDTTKSMSDTDNEHMILGGLRVSYDGSTELAAPCKAVVQQDVTYECEMDGCENQAVMEREVQLENGLPIIKRVCKSCADDIDWG